MLNVVQQQTYKIATNTGVISRPGAKPDFGTGLLREQLTAWQRQTRRELTFNMVNQELTPGQIAKIIKLGGTITAWHTGGKDCKLPFEGRNGEVVKHICRNKQHRCNDNFLAAQHLGADFDNLTSMSEIYQNPLVLDYGSIIYQTPSSTPEKPKARVIFLLDTPVTDGKLYKRLLLAMLWKFEEKADPSCTDYCRLFYGNFGCQPLVTGQVLPLAVAMGWLKEYEATRPVKPVVSYQTIENADPKRLKAFGDAVLNRACQKVKDAAKGNRHYELKRQGFNVFTFVHGGVISRSEARYALENAYRSHVANPTDMQDLLDWCEDHARDYAQGLPVETSQSRVEWYASRGYHYAFR